jgi:uracil-DNA glycosylase
MDPIDLIEPIETKETKEPIDQTWSVIRIAIERPPKGWEEVFKGAIDEIAHVSSELDKEEKTFGPYFPLKCELFTAFEWTPLNLIKILLIGQDPYHDFGTDGLPQAIGASFSVRKGVMVPPSLKNIYKELSNSIDGFRIPSHGYLEKLGRQGVFLLNTCLTVRPHQPKSHGQVWRGLLERVLKAILSSNKNCIFILLGKDAQAIGKQLGGLGIILETSHPSPLSARYGFLGSNIFKRANQLLIANGQDPIDWNLD